MSTSKSSQSIKQKDIKTHERFLRSLFFKIRINGVEDEPKHFVCEKEGDVLYSTFSYGVVKYKVKIINDLEYLDNLTQNLIRDFKAEDSGDYWREYVGK